MTIIYALVDPDNDIVGYVGQTVDPQGRYDAHIDEGKSVVWSYQNEGICPYPVTQTKANWIGYLIIKGRYPEMRKLEYVAHEVGVSYKGEVDACEHHWIVEMLARGEPLTNALLPHDLIKQRGVAYYHNAYDNCPYRGEFTQEQLEAHAAMLAPKKSFFEFDLSVLDTIPSNLSASKRKK